MMPPPRDLAIIRSSRFFDAAWYRDRYPDVALSGMEPAAHILRFGRLLRRDPGPDFDTGFCIDSYADIAGSTQNPLVVLERAACAPTRPTTRRQWENQIAAARAGLHPRAPISLFVTAHDLDAALIATLRSAAACIGPNVAELVVVDATFEPALGTWLAQMPGGAMGTGCLHHLILRRRADAHPAGIDQVLDRSDLGRLVVQLAPGQTISPGELEGLRTIDRDHPNGFVLHRLLGAWDDPAAHQTIMPNWLFTHAAADARRLAWGADGMDRVLTVLDRFPAVPLLHEADRPAILAQSPPYRDLHRAQPLVNRVVVTAPISPKLGADRAAPPVTEAPLPRDALRFNATLSAVSRLRDPGLRQEMQHRLNRHKMRLVETIPADQVIGHILSAPSGGGPLAQVPADQISLFVCVRNEADFLRVLIPHYRRLGVSRFFVIDDGSAVPVAAAGREPDVTVLQPICADFRTAKSFWIGCLMKAVLTPGAWTLTVDADEFLHLPPPFSDLRQLTGHLSDSGRDFATALLLDMAPAPGSAPPTHPQDPRQGLTHFLDDPTPPSASYLGDPAVLWGFGPGAAALSWRFDLRHRLFGTVDSLRKLPLFRYRPDRHPNQGFHTFDHLDAARDPGPEVWNAGPVLPLLHYKLARLFDDARRAAMVEAAENYHARTGSNIVASFGAPPGVALARLVALADRLRPADDLGAVGLAFARPQSTLVGPESRPNTTTTPNRQGPT